MTSQKSVSREAYRVRFFGKIQIRISDTTTLGSWCIKGTDEPTLGKDSSLPLMHHDPSDLGAKIRSRIFPKRRTLRVQWATLTFPSYSPPSPRQPLLPSQFIGINAIKKGIVELRF